MRGFCARGSWSSKGKLATGKESLPGPGCEARTGHEINAQCVRFASRREGVPGCAFGDSPRAFPET